MVLGNLTDLCLTWTWFLMISGNPSSKCQRVWPQIRPTFDISICTKLKGLIFDGVCCPLLVFSCAGPGIFARKTSKLQGSRREIHYFLGGPLTNFYGNLYNLWCSRGLISGPPAFIRIRTCFFFNTFFTYLPIFNCVVNHFTRLYKVRT